MPSCRGQQGTSSTPPRPALALPRHAWSPPRTTYSWTR